MGPTLDEGRNCIFCALPADTEAIVSEGANVITVMDRYPVAEGHLLVLPRVHITDLMLAPADLVGSVFREIQRIGLAMRRVHQTDRIGVFSAGKEIPEHLHFHMMPLEKGIIATLAERAQHRSEIPLQARLEQAALLKASMVKL